MYKTMLAAGFLLAVAIVLTPTAASSTATPGGPWAGADKVLAQQGKDLPGGVHRYAWPRRDLKVMLDGVQLEPALALGSWAGFLAATEPGYAMAMGDLVLLPDEVTPVIKTLQAGGLAVTAVHNHLMGETPQVIYVHFEGRGMPEELAGVLKAALSVTATPLAGDAQAAPRLSVEETEAVASFQKALGVNGKMAGRVLQIGIPRVEPIEDGGMTIPPSLGMACGINVQTVGTRVATTGDFVLTSSEIEGVAKALEDHGIEVTAIHSHMLTETPRLFFMHFWGLGTPQAVGAGLRVALENARVQGISGPAPRKD